MAVLPLSRVFTARALAAVFNRYAETISTAPYLGRAYFGTDKKMGLNMAFIKGRKGMAVALKASNFDAKAPLRDAIGFKRIEKFIGIGRIRLGLNKSRDPLKLIVDIHFSLLATLIFPMRADTVLSDLVHLPGSYLNLERNTVATDNGGVERAVHIGLRR